MKKGELAERIGEREYTDPTATQLRDIALSLHHNHLPRLEAADVVAYDENDGTISPHLNFDRLIRILEMMNERDLPWSAD